MNNYTGKTIVFFGDSVTEGCFDFYKTDYGFDCYKHPELSYVFKVSRLLRECFGDCIKTVNAGRRGDFTGGALRRIENDVLLYHPDIVTVAFGLNDCFHPAEQFMKNAGEIIKKIAQAGAVPVIITPNMMNTYIHENTEPSALKVAEKTKAFQNNGTLDYFSDFLIRLSEKESLPFFDVYGMWKELYNKGTDTTCLLANYINHPAESMHDMIVPGIYTLIRNIL